MQASRPSVTPLRHLLFDLDGTLVDSSRISAAIIDAMLADRGIDFVVEPATVRAMDAVGGEAMIAAAMGPFCREPAGDLAEFRARYAVVDIPSDLAFPGVVAGLSALASAGLVMAICSNKPQVLCDRILGELRLKRYFSAIIGARPGLPRKPAPDPAVLALHAIGARPETACYIGDSDVDVATATAAGLPIALAGWGYGVAGARKAATGAPVFADMPSLVDNLLSRQSSPPAIAKPARSS